MGLLLTLITGLALWIVLWGTSLMKSFDAFLIAMLLVLLAATARIIVPFLPGGRR
jgi:Mn2+/Fe2+ NRAMP family transporter